MAVLISLWSALMHVIIALLGGCQLVTHVTSFSCDVFGFLIAIIYCRCGDVAQRSLPRRFAGRRATCSHFSTGDFSVLDGAALCQHLVTLSTAAARAADGLRRSGDGCALYGRIIHSAVVHSSAASTACSANVCHHIGTCVAHTIRRRACRGYLRCVAAGACVDHSLLLRSQRFIAAKSAARISSAKTERIQLGFLSVGVNAHSVRCAGPACSEWSHSTGAATRALACRYPRGEHSGRHTREVYVSVQENRIESLQAVLIGCTLPSCLCWALFRNRC